MYNSLDALWTDRVYRQAYGEDVGYDPAKGVPMTRAGVGSIESGPSNPKAKIPNATMSPVTGPIQEIPGAFGPETVMPARLQAKTADKYGNSEKRSIMKAQSRLKDYLKKVNSGKLK
jgi:hypothetical protein